MLEHRSGPEVGEVAGQVPGQLFHRQDRFSLAVPRGRCAVYGHRAKYVVALDEGRSLCRLDRDQRGQRHHVTRLGAHVEGIHRIGPGSRVPLSLGRHPEGAPEKIEVVDVVAAEERLQGIEDIRDRNAELARPVAIDDVLDLRHMVVELGGDPRQFLALVGLSDELLNLVVESVERASGGIRQHEFEATGLTDARDRGRRHGDDIRLLDRPEQPGQPLDQPLSRALAARPLRPGLEHNDSGAGVRCVDLGEEVEPRDSQHGLDLGLLLDDLPDVLQHLLGPLQGGGGRQLYDHQQVTLVILG